MLKGNCRKKNLTTCERKNSSYQPALAKVIKTKKAPKNESNERTDMLCFDNQKKSKGLKKINS